LIPVSVMVTGRGTVSERIKGRYGPGRPSAFSSELRPVVFWNITYLCNLRCAHCYINAGPEPRREELSRDDLLRVAREIADLGLPLVIFSGGEPLMRRDFWDVAQELSGRDRPKLALSTNGTLITRDVARRLSRWASATSAFPSTAWWRSFTIGSGESRGPLRRPLAV